MAERENVIHFESSYDEAITIAVGCAGDITISVAEEKAVDSYNRMFKCTYELSNAEAAQLRDWLIARLAPTPKAEERE